MATRPERDNCVSTHAKASNGRAGAEYATKPTKIPGTGSRTKECDANTRTSHVPYGAERRGDEQPTPQLRFVWPGHLQHEASESYNQAKYEHDRANVDRSVEQTPHMRHDTRN
jgi:hypothetical protein